MNGQIENMEGRAATIAWIINIFSTTEILLHGQGGNLTKAKEILENDVSISDHSIAKLSISLDQAMQTFLQLGTDRTKGERLFLNHVVSMAQTIVALKGN